MYECINQPRGCRVRTNVKGTRCADCVVCSIPCSHCTTTRCHAKKRKQTLKTTQSANFTQSQNFSRPVFASALGQPRDYKRMLPSERFGDFSINPQLWWEICPGTVWTSSSPACLLPVRILASPTTFFVHFIHYSYWRPIRCIAGSFFIIPALHSMPRFLGFELRGFASILRIGRWQGQYSIVTFWFWAS